MPPSQRSMSELLFKSLLTLLSSIAVLFVIVQIGSLLYSIVVLLAIATVFSYVLLAPVDWTERGIVFISQKLHQNAFFRKIARCSPDINPRIFAVITVFSLFFTAITLSGSLLLPQLSHQVKDFGKALPRYITQVEEHLLEWSGDTIGGDTLKKIFEADIVRAEKAGVVKNHSPETAPITEEEKKVIQDSVFRSTLIHAAHFLEHAASSAFENVIGLVTHTLNGLVYFLTGVVLIFYFLLDGHKVKDGVLLMLPKSVHTAANYFFSSVHQVMFNFVKGQVLLAFVSGIFMFILYSLFSVKYAIFLSAFFTVAEILPVIGPWIAFTPGILVILFSDHPEHAFYIWFIYVLIKDNFILPKVVGDVMGLHPVVVIFSILICAKLGGLIGVVLALPIASVLNVILRYYFNPPPEPEDRIIEGFEGVTS